MTTTHSPTPEDWRARVERELGPDRDFEQALVSRTLEGIDVQPLYTAAGAPSEAPAGAVSPRGGGWTIAQRVGHPSPKEANQHLLADLAGGANGCLIQTAGADGGVELEWIHDLDQLLDGVYLEAIPIAFGTNGGALPLAAQLSALCAERDVAPEAVEAHLGMDPFATLAAQGSLPGDLTDARREACELAGHAALHMGRSRALAVDASPWYRAGGHAVQELGYALAAYAEVLRWLTSAGMSPEDADAQLVWRFDVGHDLVTEVAKLRALRLLHAKVLGAFGAVEAAPLVLHATTSPRGLARRDHWTNMLRTTLGAFAASMGGADLITTLPHDRSLGTPSALGRRNARNIQLVLAREARLDHVGDPARGAYAFEARTDALARGAWDLMQGIEAEGGFGAALTAGGVDEALRGSRESLIAELSTRRRPVVGVSVFPPTEDAEPPDQHPLEDPDRDARRARLAARGDVVLGPVDDLPHAIRAAAAGATLEEIGEGLVRGAPLQRPPLPSFREAAVFEDLAPPGADAPAAFLACLGPLSAHSARSAFAEDLLRAGGFSVARSEPDLGPEALGEAFHASGAQVACVCAGKGADAQLEEATCTSLRAAGARFILLARRPSGGEEGVDAAGHTGHIFAGCDAATILEDLRAVAATSSHAEASR